MENEMSLDLALRVLADSHTRDDYQIGFVIEMGGPSYFSRWSQGQYIEAWKTVRAHLHMATEPEAA